MLRVLLERRSRLIAEMRALTTSPAGEGGDLSAEQNTKFDSLKAELETVERQIERQRFVDEAERRMQGQRLTGSGDGQFDALCREASLSRAIASQIDRSIDAGREIEISQELARRSGRSSSPTRASRTTTPATGPARRRYASRRSSPGSCGGSARPVRRIDGCPRPTRWRA